ncbi:MAG: antibiotic biosynthesis monooxygenase [Chloroflexi bacterium]|nr:antibiotic biosynthesis monooxygenase [Chloroflexota bacterium]
MFGTLCRMRPRAGQEAAVVELYRRWDRERRPRVPGALAAYLYRPRQRLDELIGVVVFESEDSYVANANDPEQDRWYRQLRELLEADPEWDDGDVILAAVWGER